MPSIIMKNNDVDTEVGPKETSRLEGFSDGVFAIAITLLILDLIQVMKEKAMKDYLHTCSIILTLFLLLQLDF